MKALVPLASALLFTSAPALAAPPEPDPWFGRDKALHFGASAGLAGAGYGVTSLATEDIRLRVVFGAGTALLAGISKELLDLGGTGTPSGKDLAWDLAGTLVGVGIAVSIDLLVRGLGRVRVTAQGQVFSPR